MPSAEYMRRYRLRKKAEKVANVKAALNAKPPTTNEARLIAKVAELEEEIRHLKQVIAANRSDWVTRMSQEERDAILRKVATARR